MENDDHVELGSSDLELFTVGQVFTTLHIPHISSHMNTSWHLVTRTICYLFLPLFDSLNDHKHRNISNTTTLRGETPNLLQVTVYYILQIMCIHHCFITITILDITISFLLFRTWCFGNLSVGP